MNLFKPISSWLRKHKFLWHNIVAKIAVMCIYTFSCLFTVALTICWWKENIVLKLYVQAHCVDQGIGCYSEPRGSRSFMQLSSAHFYNLRGRNNRWSTYRVVTPIKPLHRRTNNTQFFKFKVVYYKRQKFSSGGTQFNFVAFWQPQASNNTSHWLPPIAM